MKKVTDGIQNRTTGLGTARDKSKNASFVYLGRSQKELDAAYRSDDITARIVDKNPEECFREGWQWITENEAHQKLLEEEFTRINAKEALLLAMKEARHYGGGVILLGIDDNVDYEEPIQINEIKNITWLTNFSFFDLTPLDIQNDPRLPNYGRPQKWRIATTGEQLVVHDSRLIKFTGKRAPKSEIVDARYLGDSYITKAYDILRDVGQSFASIGYIISEFYRPTYKITGFRKLLAEDKDNLISKTIQHTNREANILKAVVIDKDDEFTRDSVNVAGFKDLVDLLLKRLTMVAEMPHTILFGESPSGLGATGDSEAKDYYDAIKLEQINVLKPKLLTLAKIISAANNGPIKNKDLKIDVEFNSLWQMDAQESANIEKTKEETKSLQANRDQIYLMNEVLMPKEIRDSRFGEDDSDIILDKSFDEITNNLDKSLPT